MFELKYKNCCKIHDKQKHMYEFYAFDKDNQIIIKNCINEFEIIISSNNKLLINDKEIKNNKIKLLLRSLEKINIKMSLNKNTTETNKLKIYYKKKKDKNIKKLLQNNDIQIINNKITEYTNNIITENNKKYILHIIHSFGGGTEVYVLNMKKIFTDINHIILYIESENNYIIDGKNFCYNELDLLFKKINLVFVHHLLFNDNNKLQINKKIINYLYLNNKIKKNFIAHDYFLFYPENPNPIKRQLTIPTKKNIDYAQKLLNNFDLVIFNSNNTYLNYTKYLQLPNYFILNNIPDINFYSSRKFVSIKKKYNICLLGNIGCEHKGRYLATKIFEYFKENEKYHFIILGEYIMKFNNVSITGKYNNDDIFNIINDKKIDYFLFVSVFEETYSFCLSIALKTGLPIIYNNIGSYTDRLQNCINAYGFEEDNYIQIEKILENIEQNNLIYDDNVKQYSENNLTIHLPELNKIIFESNNINFSEFKINIINKAVCFIHFTNLGNGFDILNNQINYIKTSGLYDKIDYIFIVNLGKTVYLHQDYKIKLLYYSDNPGEWEFPSINLIKEFSNYIDTNVKILYLHTKGVLNKSNSYEWRKYLEYFLIEKHCLCFELLDKYYCVGVNQQFYFDNENYKRNHFSGNFWWTNSNYIKNLPEFKKSDDRYFTEHYLIGDLTKTDYRYIFSMHHNEYDLYKIAIQPNEYNFEIIKLNIINNLQNAFIKKRKIYGIYFICCLENYYNIVQEQINKLVLDGLYEITDNIYCFICNYNDIILNILNKYDKIIVISTPANLYEKFAINNFKKYISDEYYLYYFHSKSVSRKEKCYNDWRILCDYFTLTKWRLSIELLNYYDCVGINMKQFPKMHYSGNYWWSKSEHLNKLTDIDNNYLSPEMYIMSYIKTNKICIYQSNVTHGNTDYNENIYSNISEIDLINNLTFIPQFNLGDKSCINMCGIDLTKEPNILN